MLPMSSATLISKPQSETSELLRAPCHMSLSLAFLKLYVVIVIAKIYEILFRSIGRYKIVRQKIDFD